MKKRWMLFLLLTMSILGVSSMAEEYCNHENSYFTANENYHYWHCDDCGVFPDRDNHYVDCNAPDICRVCGFTGIQKALISHVAYQYFDLGECHQLQCTQCGFAKDAVPHQSECTNPSYCPICDFDGVIVYKYNVRHDCYFVNLGPLHQWQCRNCSYKESPSHHAVSCYSTRKDWCFQCQSHVEDIPWEDSEHHDTRMVNLGDCHQWVCTNCGLTGEPEPHRIDCAMPGVCWGCGTSAEEFPEAELEHSINIDSPSVITFNTTTHTIACSGCGLPITDPHEAYYWDGSCYCGYELSPRIPGDANNDGMATIQDALHILQYDIGWSITVNTSNGDVNADGLCNILDALLILQYDVGWNVTLQ